MAVSQNQRLQKAAAKAAKRKAVVAQKLAQERRDSLISKPRHIDFATSPIRDCLFTTGAFESGVGTLIVARSLSGGRVGFAAFLLDLWCLGVKDGFYHVRSASEFQEYVEHLGAASPLEPIEPSEARRLLRSLVSYAASLGFPASSLYADLEPIFGDTPLADTTFTFGKDGKPFYAVGPHDSQRRIRRILATLAAKLGEHGFDFISPFDAFDGDFDDEDDEDADFDEDGETIEGEVVEAVEGAKTGDDPDTPQGDARHPLRTA